MGNWGEEKNHKWSYGLPFVMIVKAHFVGFCFFFCCRGERLEQLEKDSKGCFVAEEMFPWGFLKSPMKWESHL